VGKFAAVVVAVYGCRLVATIRLYVFVYPVADGLKQIDETAIKSILEQYGQLVKEAAAEVLEAQATCGCQGKHGYCMTDGPPKAHAMLLREMPLP